MRLYLLRHAEAIPRGTAGYAQDAARPLTDEGRRQARQVAKGLQRLGVPAEVIVASPYVRAAQTAEEVARVLAFEEPVRTLEALRAEAKPRETSAALAALASHDHVVLVGHEPHLSAWLAELVAGEDGLRCVFKKGGVACVEVERVPPPRGSGTLRWLMTPKQLDLIGAAP